jgi:hypothetical protein
MNRERSRGDEEYLAMLRDVTAPVPVGRVDWEALYARVDAAAALPLSRRREAASVAAAGVRRVGEGAWWEYAARRGRAAIPLAIAASVAFLAYVRGHPIEGSSAAVVAASTGDVRDAFEATVTDGGSSQRVATLLVSSPADADSVASDVTQQ